MNLIRGAKIGFFRTWFVMAQNIVAARELIWQLFHRDFLMAYKKSFLSMTWIFIAPLIGIISWVFMNATGILNPGEVGIPYPAFVLFSSSIWGLFMGLYGAASGTLDVGERESSCRLSILSRGIAYSAGNEHRIRFQTNTTGAKRRRVC